MADSTVSPSESLSDDQLGDIFIAQPAQLSEEERDTIETRAFGTDDITLLRLGLGSLTKSGAELIEAVSGSRETAVGTAQVSEQLEDYATRLRSLADMLNSASLRLGIALCAREDMESILEEAKASNVGPQVGHG